MLQAGAFVKEEVCRALIVLISNAPELHGYAARCMYQALKSNLNQADIPLSLVTCTSWFLGEQCLAARRNGNQKWSCSLCVQKHTLVSTQACQALKSSLDQADILLSPVTCTLWFLQEQSCDRTALFNQCVL